MDRSEQSFQEASNENQVLLDLISKASSGDNEALSRLLSDPAFENRVRRIAASVLKRYGSRGVYETSEDLKQEVYLRVLSNITGMRDIRSEGQFVGWILSVARNIYIDRLRRSVLENRSVAEDDLSQTDRTAMENQYNETALKEVLEKLDPKKGKIVRLFLQGYTARQIADELDISPHTTYRLVKQIQKTILGEVDELTTKMKESQIEIEQEKELTRHLINDLRA